MKSICIFGAGGFAKEVACIAKPIAFIDIQAGKPILDIPVETIDFFEPDKHVAIVAVGDPNLRDRIGARLSLLKHGAQFANLIAPSAKILDKSVKYKCGAVICDGCILTCDISLGEHVQLNLNTTIGHDCVIGDYFTTAPGVHISGNCQIGHHVYFGTNSCTIEGISICDRVTIGAGAVVTKDITEPGTYVGVPARRIK